MAPQHNSPPSNVLSFGDAEPPHGSAAQQKGLAMDHDEAVKGPAPADLSEAARALWVRTHLKYPALRLCRR